MNPYEPNIPDSLQPSNNTFTALGIACGVAALIISIVGLWLHIASRPADGMASELASTKIALSNTVTVAQQLLQQRNELAALANKKQRFIDETFAHFGRFFTNAFVSEMEWSPGKIATSVDTNAFMQEWRYTVTPSNVTVKKMTGVPVLELLESKAPPPR